MQEKKCMICGGKVEVWKKEPDGLPYWACGVCDFVQKDEKKWLNDEQEKERYETHENNAKNKGYVRMFEEFLAVILPYTQKVQKVLDFGCGPGPVLAEIMRKKGWEVDTYDPYFAKNEEWKEKKYDLITSTEVFEHLKKPLEEMQSLAKRLNEGGVLVVMTRFHPRVEGEFLDWWYRRDPTHISFFSPLTMARMASESGLRMKMTDGEKVVVLEKMAKRKPPAPVRGQTAK